MNKWSKEISNVCDKPFVSQSELHGRDVCHKWFVRQRWCQAESGKMNTPPPGEQVSEGAGVLKISREQHSIL